MKKIFLTLALAAASLAASAQVYVGGEVGFWRNADANTTSFTLAPQVGYTLSEKWDLGIGIGFAHNYNKGRKTNAFNVDPYARLHFLKFGPVSIFTDMGFGVGVYKQKDADDSEVAWQIGLQPGVRVSLAKNIDFVAHVGFLGYREADSHYALYGSEGFGFQLSGNDLSFGINYRF